MEAIGGEDFVAFDFDLEGNDGRGAVEGDGAGYFAGAVCAHDVFFAALDAGEGADVY